MSFCANIRFSKAGISARDARVAVEVVYHHDFFVLGQRSVKGAYVFAQTSKFWESYKLSVAHQGRTLGKDGARNEVNDVTYLSIKELLYTRQALLPVYA